MKQMELEAVNLTNECLSRFWQKDYIFVANLCTEDAVWIGSVQKQYIVGHENILQDFCECAEELQPCHLINAEFQAVACDSKLCVVTGRYLVTTDSSADYFLQVQQRCTFVWERTAVELRARHIHVSNPMGELKIAQNEMFPNTMGKMAHRYIMHHIEQRSGSQKITAYGTGGSLHFFQMSDIVYISAMGKESTVKTLNGETDVKSSISELSAQAGDALVSVHRSYPVNPDYITTIERYSVTLATGDKLPIPEKKYNALRDILMNSH